VPRSDRKRLASSQAIEARGLPPFYDPCHGQTTMSKRLLSKRILMSACAAVMCACSSDSPSSSAASGTAGAAGAAGDMASASSECPADYREFRVGEQGLLVTDPASGIGVRLLDGPVPPNFGNNTWTIGLQDASGAAVTNAHLTWACAYMTVHAHGSMFGPWEVKLWLDPTGAAAEYAPQGGAGTLIRDACTPSSGPMGKPTVEFKVCVPQSSGD
jgi:hypothetical protein